MKSKSKQGHLRQPKRRVDGKWRKSNWFLVYYERGQRKEVSTGTKDKQEAEAFRSSFMARWRGRGGSSLPESVTVGDLLDLVEEDYRAQRRKSTDDVDGKIAVLRDLVGSMKAAQVGSAAVKDLTRRLRGRAGKLGHKELSNGSINRYMAVLRRAFRLGVQHEPPMVDRVPLFRRLPEAQPRQGVLSHERYRALKEHLPHYARLALVLAYHTGMRAGELLEIQTTDVDMEAGVIRLRAETTKNSETKTVPIYGEMRAELELAIGQNDVRCPYLVQRWAEGGRVFRYSVRQQDGSYAPSLTWSIRLKDPATVKMLRAADLPEAWALRRVLPIKAATEAAAADVLAALGADRRGEPVHGFRRAWRSACRACGVPGLLFHDLRRTAATNARAAGLDEQLIMEIGGWKTPSMLRRYGIKTPERMRRAAAALERRMLDMQAELPAPPQGRPS